MRPAQVQVRWGPSLGGRSGRRVPTLTTHQEPICHWHQLAKGKSVLSNAVSLGILTILQGRPNTKQKQRYFVGFFIFLCYFFVCLFLCYCCFSLFLFCFFWFLFLWGIFGFFVSCWFFFKERENLKLGGEEGGEELGGIGGGKHDQNCTKMFLFSKLKGSVSTKAGNRCGWQTSPTNHNITFQWMKGLLLPSLQSFLWPAPSFRTDSMLSAVWATF